MNSIKQLKPTSMKKITMLSFLLLLSLCMYSQDYLIHFAGTGGSTSVDNVKVENLTQGTTLTLNGTDILNLKGESTTGINVYNTSERNLKVYPNPATDYATIEFIAAAQGNATIAIYDQVGKTIVRTVTNLEKGTHTYQIDGMGSGVFIIGVTSETYSYAGKIVSQQKGTANARITRKNFSDCTENESRFKSTNATIQMSYTTGNRLKFTGISGNYSTVLTDIPTGNKTITFDFIACTDGDNNHYPVVKIGTQTWMVENLKTTKFNNGTEIPNEPTDAWPDLTTPAYCWYDNDAAANKATYGALYNWYAVNTGMLCPAGWHVPSDAEWTTLINYLGGESVAGDKLKETGSVHWIYENIGTNEVGFTALPAGARWDFDDFCCLLYKAYWWSTTEYDADNGWFRFMDGYPNVYSNGRFKYNGMSVRCVKN
jgi:uncharacterized protein (TIGR02145 family)